MRRVAVRRHWATWSRGQSSRWHFGQQLALGLGLGFAGPGATSARGAGLGRVTQSTGACFQGGCGHSRGLCCPLRGRWPERCEQARHTLCTPPRVQAWALAHVGPLVWLPLPSPPHASWPWSLPFHLHRDDSLYPKATVCPLLLLTQHGRLETVWTTFRPGATHTDKAGVVQSHLLWLLLALAVTPGLPGSQLPLCSPDGYASASPKRWWQSRE